MALPSQSSRGLGPRARVSRSRSKSGARRLLGLVVVGGLVIAAVWWLWPSAVSAPADPAGPGNAGPGSGGPVAGGEPPRDGTLASSEGATASDPLLPDGTRSLSPATAGAGTPNRTLTDALEAERARLRGGTGSPDRDLADAVAPMERPGDAERAEASEATEPAPPPPAVATLPPGATTATALVEADGLLERGRIADAAGVLDAALRRASTESDRRRLRTKLAELNRTLIFSPSVVPGVWMTEAYRVQAGDNLERIAYRNDLGVDWRLIARINNIADPSKIQVGQTLKLVRGPFHARVHKNAYRMDLFHGSPDEPEDWRYIRSFAVGLGEYDGTPTGMFRVRRDSKLVNPAWINPRTGERFAADDPENPIGERWIGLEGLGEASRFTGYGIHGTIEPDSIGSQASMGCVRLHNDDVEIVYELLAEQVSVVIIED